MAHEDLIPFNELTQEEQKKLARAGGIASGKARREKRNMMNTLNMLLQLTVKSGEATKPEYIKSLADIKGANVTVEQAIMLAQVQKALKGDTSATSFIRDTSGNKLPDKIEADVETNTGALEGILEQLKEK